MREKRYVWLGLFLVLIVVCIMVVKQGSQIVAWAEGVQRRYDGFGSSVSVVAAAGKTVSVEESLEEGEKEAEAIRQQRQEQEKKINAYIEGCIADMTLEQKLCQMMILTNENDITEENLRRYQPGGVIFFGVDFKGKTVEEVGNRVERLQSYMTYPLFVGVDEEGGDVSRISGLLDEGLPRFSSARQLGEQGDMEVVREETVSKSELLQKMGINLNFDPVADVVTKASAYMYQRSAGGDAGVVSDYVTAVVETMEEQNMGSCLKHFPGYGDNGNTHTNYLKDSRSLEQYQQSDFLPFQAGIAAGADMIMVSHIVMEAVDKDNPASLSLAVHEMIREEFGFDGVVIADDLNMQAILSQMTLDEAAGEALTAGNDMIFSADLSATLKGMREAVDSGKVDEEQIDESVKRILRMKIERKLIG
jgi:beta-N-acetylhexosaminidase